MTSFVTQDLAKQFIAGPPHSWVPLWSGLRAVSFGPCGCMLCRSKRGGSVHFHCYHYGASDTCLRPRAKDMSDVSNVISTLYVIECYQEFIESRTIDQTCVHIYKPVWLDCCDRKHSRKWKKSPQKLKGTQLERR